MPEINFGRRRLIKPETGFAPTGGGLRPGATSASIRAALKLKKRPEPVK